MAVVFGCSVLEERSSLADTGGRFAGCLLRFLAVFVSPTALSILSLPVCWLCFKCSSASVVADPMVGGGVTDGPGAGSSAGSRPGRGDVNMGRLLGTDG